MIRKAIFALVAVVCLSSLAFGKNDPTLSDSELAAITERGRLLAGFDNAAWHGSDAAQATKPKDGVVKRYIARKTDAGWVVAFGRLNDTKDNFLVAFEAFDGSGSAVWTRARPDLCQQRLSGRPQHSCPSSVWDVFAGELFKPCRVLRKGMCRPPHLRMDTCRR